MKNYPKLRNPITGKTFVVAGDLKGSIPYLGRLSAEDLITSFGGIVQDPKTPADFLVIADKRKKGRAATIGSMQKYVDAGETCTLDELAFFDLFQADLQGQHFVFAGEFTHGPFAVASPASMIEKVGGVVLESVDERMDFLVVADRRAKGKTAILRDAAALKGRKAFMQIDEDAFLAMIQLDYDQHSEAGLDYSGFVAQLSRFLDKRRLDRALKMLKGESFELYNDIEGHQVRGIVKSQTGFGTVYSSWINHDGYYHCTSEGEDPCMGLQGAVCKHITLLLLGLTRSGSLDLQVALDWAKAAAKKKPQKDEEETAELYLRYQGLDSSELDWRPLETLPEDFLDF